MPKRSVREDATEAAAPDAVEAEAARRPDAGDRLAILAAAVAELRRNPREGSRTTKLLSGGVPKMAKKVVEEAAEIAIDAARGERAAVIRESADLFYNLTVLLSELGVEPAEVWAEMDRRQALYGLAEKVPKTPKPSGGQDPR